MGPSNGLLRLWWVSTLDRSLVTGGRQRVPETHLLCSRLFPCCYSTAWVSR